MSIRRGLSLSLFSILINLAVSGALQARMVTDPGDPGPGDPAPPPTSPLNMSVGPSKGVGPGQTRALLGFNGAGGYTFSIVGISPYRPEYRGTISGSTYIAPAGPVDSDYTITLQVKDSAGATAQSDVYLHPEAFTFRSGDCVATDQSPACVLYDHYLTFMGRVGSITRVGTGISIEGGRAGKTVTATSVDSCGRTYWPIAPQGTPLTEWGSFADLYQTRLSSGVTTVTFNTPGSYMYLPPDNPVMCSPHQPYSLITVYFTATDGDGTSISFAVKVTSPNY
jgi:hypothetical protein